jgi:hypothetical protein
MIWLEDGANHPLWLSSIDDLLSLTPRPRSRLEANRQIFEKTVCRAGFRQRQAVSKNE